METVLAAIAAMATTAATAAAAAIKKGKEREKKRGRDRGRCQWVAASDKTWAAAASVLTATSEAAAAAAAAEKTVGTVFAARDAPLVTVIEAAAALKKGTEVMKGENSSHSRETAAENPSWVVAAAAATAAPPPPPPTPPTPTPTPTQPQPPLQRGSNLEGDRKRGGGLDRWHCTEATGTTWLCAAAPGAAAIAAGITEAEAGITTAAEAATVPTAPPAGKYTRQLGQHYLTSTETTANRQTSKKMLDQHYMMSTETTANRHIFNRQQLNTGWSIASHTAGSICLPRKPCTKRQTTNQAASGALWHTLLPLDTSCPHPTHTPHTTKQHPAPPLDPFLLPEPFSSVQAPALHP